jgi:hypothetical protein
MSLTKNLVIVILSAIALSQLQPQQFQVQAYELKICTKTVAPFSFQGQ